MRAKHAGDDSDATDYVFEHTKILLTIGLFKQYVDKMIKYGDGVKLIEGYKHLLVWCKVLGLHNYSNGLLELQYQIRAVPEHLQLKILYGRFVNTKGKADTNYAVDLAVEHENKYFKEVLSSYRGEYTQDSIDKVSKAGNVTKVMLDTLKTATSCHSKKSGTHTSRPQTDMSELISKLKSANLTKAIDHRKFQKVLLHPRILVDNRESCEKWAEKKIKVFNTKHYYRYANSKIGNIS